VVVVCVFVVVVVRRYVSDMGLDINNRERGRGE
jgi:hypothetical protein